MAKLIPQATVFKQPSTEDDLAKILRETAAGNDPDGTPVVILAGGTSLAFSRPGAETIIDLNALPFRGCRINADGGLSIGTVTTIGELERDPAAASFCGGILRQATDTLASTPLRNLITVGGNLAAGYAWCDLPVVFLALDASVEMFPGQSLVNLPGEGDRSFRRLAGNGEIIQRIHLSGRYRDGRGAFIKFARTHTDLALVSVAVAFRLENGMMNAVRAACGGLVPIPRRLMAVEQMLEGQAPENTLFQTAAAAIDITPRPDTRAEAAYRLDVLKTLIPRAFSQALKEQSHDD